MSAEPPTDFFEKPKHIVVAIPPNALSLAKGQISANKFSKELREQAYEACKSPQILVEVNRPDDGCGDGRCILIKEGNPDFFRAKIFGGGPTMFLAGLIGVNSLDTNNLLDAFNTAIKLLEKKGVDFGGHIDDSNHDDNKCGCGAIDNAPTILDNIQYFDKETIEELFAWLLPKNSESFLTNLPTVLDNFKTFSNKVDSENYSGKEVIGNITNNNKTVVTLTGDHKEGIIILNYVPGTTVNQQVIRDATQGQMDAFVVDIWRLEEIAQKAFEQSEKDKAIIGMILFTLAVASTLTDGTLPIYQIQ